MAATLIACAYRVENDFVNADVFTDREDANRWYSEKRDVVRRSDKSRFKEHDLGGRGLSFYTDNGSFVTMQVK